MRSEYYGSILEVRAVEDCIRVTKKYTKGVFKKAVLHPVQGGDFPSRVITEYYEVYPDLEIDWEMSASLAWAWIWGDIPHIDAWFHYDYRGDNARMEVGGGERAVNELIAGIPELSNLIVILTQGEGRKIRDIYVPPEIKSAAQTIKNIKCKFGD